MSLRIRFNAFDRFKPKTAPKPAPPPVKDRSLASKITGLGNLDRAVKADMRKTKDKPK